VVFIRLYAAIMQPHCSQDGAVAGDGVKYPSKPAQCSRWGVFVRFRTFWWHGLPSSGAWCSEKEKWKVKVMYIFIFLYIMMYIWS